MKKIATAEEMRRLDQAAVETAGIPGLILMENAAVGLLRTVREILGDQLAQRRLIIVCGKGNNGGDGYALARQLFNRGAEVTVIAAGSVAELKGDAGVNAGIFKAIGGRVVEVKQSGSIPHLPPGDLIVDGLLGTGLVGAARGLTARLIEWINNRPEPVLAIDIPSGVESDTGAAQGAAVQADWTVTMGLLKRGLVLPPGRELSGKVIIANISLPPGVRAAPQADFS